MADYNPFSRRSEHSTQALNIHRVGTLVTYLIFLITAAYYTFNAPLTTKHHLGTTIWGNNTATPFAQNSVITSIYWIVLLLLQLVYAWSLYSKDSVYVNAAANIGSHYIASNLLLFGFVHLWTRSYFWLAELLIVINFFNLSAAYFRHSTTPRLIHIGTVAGPLAWNFVALYWVGARAVATDRLAARIVANVFIWGILAYGAFFLAAFKDYNIGFCLSVLAFSTGVGQFLTKLPILQLQWIFAFTIGGLLFILSLGVGFPELLGKDRVGGGEIVSEDRERAPLLADDQEQELQGRGHHQESHDSIGSGATLVAEPEPASAGLMLWRMSMTSLRTFFARSHAPSPSSLSEDERPLLQREDWESDEELEEEEYQYMVGV